MQNLFEVQVNSLKLPMMFAAYLLAKKKKIV